MHGLAVARKSTTTLEGDGAAFYCATLNWPSLYHIDFKAAGHVFSQNVVVETPRSSKVSSCANNTHVNASVSPVQVSKVIDKGKRESHLVREQANLSSYQLISSNSSPRRPCFRFAALQSTIYYCSYYRLLTATSHVGRSTSHRLIC